MARGFLYLMAISNGYTRYMPVWRLSNTLDADFCVEVLEEALTKGKPENFNTDRGSQFIGEAFTGLLKQHGVRISIDGKGRYTDPDYIGMERLWRKVKDEEVYLKAYLNGREAKAGIDACFRFYNTQRSHRPWANGHPQKFSAIGLGYITRTSNRDGVVTRQSIGILRAAGPSLKFALIQSN